MAGFIVFLFFIYFVADVAFFNRKIAYAISPIFNAIFPWIFGAFLVFIIGYWVRLKFEEGAPERAMRRAEREEAERITKEQLEHNRKIVKEAQMTQYRQLRKEIQTMPKYEAWRQQVFAKCGNLCGRCGVADNLETHHNKSLYSIIKQNGIKNTYEAVECAQLWDPNNGSVLCYGCHTHMESSQTYQKMNNMDI